VTATAAPPSGLGLAALSVGQVLSWGILYYALIVAAPAISADTGWPLAAVMLSFSSGLVVSAVAGVAVGRWLDARGPRMAMTLGSVVGPAGLAVVGTAPDLPVFTLGFLVVGLAQAAVLYQAAFTVIAHRYGPRRRGAMTVLTLAGGLASTVFAPTVAALLGAVGWRAAFVILAGVLLATTVPLHWFTLENAWAPHEEGPAAVQHSVRSVVRTRRFWMLEASMLVLAATLYSTTLALIPLFTEKGLDYGLAAWALGLLGAGQVLGRLLYAALPHGAAPWVPLAATSGLGMAALALLALVPGPPWVLIAIGVAAGAVRGAHTLVQGSAVADRWGVRSYGAVNGVFAAPITIVAAFSPSLGPLLALATGSYATMALIAAGAAVVALVAARFT
jgi:predicted MFS family arabinose efflux permease